ncbi:MAG TPA: VOC family protein [Solirubrobacteraceae bacterium]|nr:VOC family protein [Solirubrobacteraceae bacterium]
MPERDRYIPGVPCWVDTSQPDPEAAARFYGGVFGWELEDSMPPGAGGAYLIARLRGGEVAAVSSIPEGAPPMATWNTYMWVDSADDAAGKVRDAGGTVMMEPFDVMDAGRMGVFADPEGAVFRVWQPERHRGASIVNEPGSLNFNGLNTRDVEGAKAFYGAVFGWRELGVQGAGMWALPGYGDHLAAGDPGMRERMAEVGAPKGFEDVVASINPMPADQPDVPAHWSVTFAVEDADATAAKVAELGGTVRVPPFDAPWVRMAVLSDPAGASFVASRFVPDNRDMEVQADSTAGAA